MKVNKYCKVNFENPTPSKKDIEVVVNIEAIDKTEGFLNFLFLMNTRQLCYEGATYYTNIKETNNIFIKEIETDITLPKATLEKLLIDNMDYDTIKGVNYIAMKIKTNDKDFYAIASNEHNGFYYHDIYYTKDTYKVTTSEDDLVINSI